jgi:hypothetical protein
VCKLAKKKKKHDPDVNRMMAIAGHHQRLFVCTDLVGTQLSSLSGGTPPHRMQAGKAGIPIFPSGCGLCSCPSISAQKVVHGRL